MLDSVRIRLTLWYVGVLALLLIAFAGLSYFLVVRILSEDTDENLEAMMLNFKTTIEIEKAEKEGRRKIEEKNIVEDAINEVIAETRFQNNSFAVFDNKGRKVGATFADEELTNALLKLNDSAPVFTTIESGNNKLRIHSIALEYEAQKYRVFVSHSLQDQTKFLSRLRSIYLLIVPLALILTGMIGYFLARKSLAPVLDMSQRAATISATNLHERLPVKNEKDELGKLAQVFNALLLRLDNSFEQQRRFMADASHELRTPLAIVRGESEIALSKQDRPGDELRESLSIVHDESKRLTKIVEDLFTLARADAGQLKITFTRIYLDELLQDCVRAVQVLAKKRNIFLESAILQEMPLEGDEQLLRRLFLNLLDNAIKYNHSGGKVSVSGEKDSFGYRILVSDTGIGISASEQTEVFDRFYRADRARSRTEDTITSGSGLGLSIVRWIAERHKGTIEIVSSDENGSVFAVRLPIGQHEISPK